MTRNIVAKTKKGTTPRKVQGTRRCPRRADGAPRASGVVTMAVMFRQAAPAACFRYLTVMPTLVAQPVVIVLVAAVIWSSVGSRAPDVSGSFAATSAGIEFALSIAS